MQMLECNFSREVQESKLHIFEVKKRLISHKLKKLCDLRYETTHVQVMSMELRKDDKTFPRVTTITILFKNEMYILNV
jgi:hypothetical protein